MSLESEHELEARIQQNAERKADGWVSVEDRLPDDGQEIITLGVPTGSQKYRTAEIRYHSEVGLIDNITHWMPLPQPPVKE